MMSNGKLSVKVAKFLMKRFESFPIPPDVKVGDLQEVFNHHAFLDGDEEQRREIMLQSSMSKYESEQTYPWDHYYGMDLKIYLQGKHVLDLGCFNGGRGIAWYEKYQMASLTGIDVAPGYIEAAIQFARLKKLNANYALAVGETLPFENASFDAIVSFDTLEHVQDLEQTLAECRRILKPSGLFLLVFPSYYQPIEHHLSLVTRAPFLQHVFSGRTLVEAYYEILQERGKSASWYRRKSPQLAPWEKGNTINGTTLAKFQRLIDKQDWKVIRHSRKPLGSIGRNATKSKVAGFLSTLFYPLVYVSALQDTFLHRVTYILEKPR